MEDSTSNEKTSLVRGCEGETSSSAIFEKRRENKTSINEEESISGRTLEESSSNEEDEVCLKSSDKEDDHEVTKLSYKQLFKLSVKLIKENDNIKKRNLDLKDCLEFSEKKSNETLMFKTVNIRN